MVDLDSYVHALKATWVRREIQSNHSWTSLFQRMVSGERNIWERNSESLMILAQEISNPFWAEVLIAYAKVTEGLDIDLDDVNRCSLWYSDARWALGEASSSGRATDRRPLYFEIR